MQELLQLAFDDPRRAVREAEGIIATSGDLAARSYAHQCLGIVLREQGRLDEASEQLHLALAAARRLRADDRTRDVLATLGGTLVFAGRTEEGLAHFEMAAEGAVGNLSGRVRMRWANVLALLGRLAEAVEVLHSAIPDLVASEDRVWEARARNLLGHIELRRGMIDRAEKEVRAAAGLLRSENAHVEVLEAVENLGDVAICRGDVAQALGHFAEAFRGYRAAGLPPRAELVQVYAAACMAGGLPGEAVTLLDDMLASGTLPPVLEAEAELLRSSALLATADPAAALEAGRTACRLFAAQGRRWFELQARLAVVLSREQLGETADLGAEACEVALALDVEDAEQAPVALAAAGRAARGDARLELWRKARPYRDRPNGLVRSSAYLAGALERQEVGDRGGVLRACGAGLDAIDEHRRLMGSSELRALATTHGRELAEIALRHAAHDPRTLLRWSERTRATALAQPPATSDVATIPASLVALRDNGRRLAEARQAGEPTEELERERLRLERAVRAESHTMSADSDPQRPAPVEEIVAGVGDGCLVELVDVDGTLHVLVVHRGRVRRRVAGATDTVADLLGPTAMLLRRASRGRPTDTADIGRRLQEAILGDAARLVPDGPVVLSPTARLHGLPWALLPVLHDRPFCIVPSAGQWLRAREVRRPRPRRTLLVAGPGLASGGAEVPVLAKRHADAVLLDGPNARVTDVLARLDGADLAHLATHGRFRADSPLFSSLDLADGPLTVHDLERLRRAPYRVVLSACESGVLAPVGAQELLGLAAALFSIGSAGLVSAVAEVNDSATADLMVALHDGLAGGQDPATALHAVRRAAAEDLVAAGTAAAFVALGV